MSNVIDFKTPAQLRDELAAKDEECQALQSQLAAVSAVKELLTLQILDMKEQVASYAAQTHAMQENLDRLLAKLSQLG